MKKKRSFLLVLLSLLTGLLLTVGALAAPLAYIGAPDLPEEPIWPNLGNRTVEEITEPLYGGWYTEITAQYGGTAQAIDVDGDRAYISQGQRLLIYDVSDPAQPQLLGQSKLFDNEAKQVVADGDYVWMTYLPMAVDHREIGFGIRVVDVSDPTNPKEIFFDEQMGRYNIHLTVRNQKAYIVDEFGTAVIWNFEDPTQPVFESSIWINPVAKVVALYEPNSGAYAGRLLALVGGAGWEVLDVTNSSKVERVLSSYSFFGRIEDMTVNGTNVFLLLSDKAVILDLSDPEYPVEKGAIFGEFATIAAIDHFLFLDDATFDVANPENPVEVSRLEAPGEYAEVDLVEIGGQRYKFIANGENGLMIVRVSTPESPEIIGGDDRAAEVHRVKQIGNLVYASKVETDTVSGQLQIFDLSIPKHFELLSTTPVHGALDFVEDGIAYFRQPQANGENGESYSGGMKLVKVSDPYHPIPSGFYAFPMSPSAMALEAPYAYIIGDNNLRIVDVSNADSLVEVGAFTTAAYANDIAVGISPADPSRRYAFLVSSYEEAKEESRLDILDVSDPNHITAAGALTFTYPSDLNSIALFESPESKLYALVGGNVDYYMGGSGSVYLIDVTEVKNPVLVAKKPLGCEVIDVQVNEDEKKVYVSAGHYGVNIYSLEGSPLDLSFVGQYRLPAYIENADGKGDFLVAAGGSSGLFQVWKAKHTEVLIDNSTVLASPSDRVKYIFPAGTFTDLTRVYHQSRYWGNMKVSADYVAPKRFFWNLMYNPINEDQYIPPTQPYTVTIGYGDLNLGSLDESTLALYRWDGTQWLPEPSSRVDVETKTVIANPVTEGTWGLMAPRPAGTILFLPLTRR